MAFDTSAVKGLAQAKAAFKAVEPTLREKLVDANGQTAQMIAFKAQQLVRRRSGTLAAHIRWTVSKRTGVATVGIGPREDVWIQGSTVLKPGVARDLEASSPGILRRQGAILEQPTHIAHMIEFGHGGLHAAPAFPFMIPAVESEQQAHLDRVRKAGQDTEQQLGGFGGGLL